MYSYSCIQLLHWHYVLCNLTKTLEHSNLTVMLCLSVFFCIFFFCSKNICITYHYSRNFLLWVLFCRHSNKMLQSISVLSPEGNTNRWLLILKDIFFGFNLCQKLSFFFLLVCIAILPRLYRSWHFLFVFSFFMLLYFVWVSFLICIVCFFRITLWHVYCMVLLHLLSRIWMENEIQLLYICILYKSPILVWKMDGYYPYTYILYIPLLDTKVKIILS